MALSVGFAKDAELQFRRDAIALTAKCRPVGSQDVVLLAKDSHLAAKHRLRAELRGQELAAMMLLPEHHYMTLGGYLTWCDNDDWTTDYKAMKPSLAVYQGVTDDLRFIGLTGVQRKQYKVGTSATLRLMAVTSEGDMLLPPSTMVIWQAV